MEQDAIKVYYQQKGLAQYWFLQTKCQDQISNWLLWILFHPEFVLNSGLIMDENL